MREICCWTWTAQHKALSSVGTFVVVTATVVIVVGTEKEKIPRSNKNRDNFWVFSLVDFFFVSVRREFLDLVGIGEISFPINEKDSFRAFSWLRELQRRDENSLEKKISLLFCCSSSLCCSVEEKK